MVLKCVLTLGLMAVAPAALAGSVGDKPVIPEVVNKSQSKAPPSEVQRFSLLKSIVTAPFRLSWSSLKFSGSANSCLAAPKVVWQRHKLPGSDKVLSW